MDRIDSGYICKKKIQGSLKKRSNKGIFVYPQISEITRNSICHGNLSENYGAASIALIAEKFNFHGKFKAENYESLVKEFLNSHFTGYKV
jgi:hypothetical protein